MNYQGNQTFDKLNLKLTPLQKGEYEQCVFKNIDFSEQDLSDYKFYDCEFIACNLSLVKTKNTSLQNIHFKDCKLLGFRFDVAQPFGLSFRFENCILNNASFFQLKIKKTTFNQCSLKEVDFTGADISEALFQQCDFSGAIFEKTNLEKANFISSFHYSIDPEVNRIKKAKFSLQGLKGLLEKYEISVEN